MKCKNDLKQELNELLAASSMPGINYYKLDIAEIQSIKTANEKNQIIIGLIDLPYKINIH